MLNHSASLAMSTSVLKALPGKLDIKKHSPSIIYIMSSCKLTVLLLPDNKILSDYRQKQLISMCTIPVSILKRENKKSVNKCKLR